MSITRNLTLIVFLSLAALLNYYIKMPILKISEQDSQLNFNSDFLKIISAGNNQLLSSMLWLQTNVFADIDQYQKDDGNSWISLRLNTITDLDPNFYYAYKYGGQYLSVIKDDVIGAERILAKGIARFNDDFWLNFYAGTNYLFELEDLDKAAIHFERIKDSPLTPKYASYIPSLLARIKAHQSDLVLAFQILYTTYQSTEDKFLKEKMFESLYSIKAEQDLDCLNTKGTPCPTRDLSGAPYIKKDKGYEAQRSWKKYRLKNINRNATDLKK